MANLQLTWSEQELLATDAVAEPLIASGVRCHGGFDATRRVRARRARSTGCPRSTRGSSRTASSSAPRSSTRRSSCGPSRIPNVAQAKYLLRAGRARADDHDAHAHRDRRGLRRDDPLRASRRPAAATSSRSIDGTAIAAPRPRPVRSARARRSGLGRRRRPQADVVRGARRRVRDAGHRGRDRDDAAAHGHRPRRAAPPPTPEAMRAARRGRAPFPRPRSRRSR